MKEECTTKFSANKKIALRKAIFSPLLVLITLWFILDICLMIVFLTSGTTEGLFYFLPFCFLILLPLLIYINGIFKIQTKYQPLSFNLTKSALQIESSNGILLNTILLNEIDSIKLESSFLEKILKTKTIYITFKNGEVKSISELSEPDKVCELIKNSLSV